MPPVGSKSGFNEASGAASQTIAVVLKGYPRLSETFIAQEIRGLEERGLSLRIISLRHPTDRHTHPVHDEIEAPVRYLPEYLYREVSRVFRAWRSVRRRPGYREARGLWLRDLLRDRTPNRVRRFGQALVLAHELEPDVTHIHAQFLHTPTSVARYAAKIAGLPWTVSAHAKDIWTTPDWEKREKLADCAWAVTCSAHAHEHLAALAPTPETVDLVYHGIDAKRFPPPVTTGSARDGSRADDPVRILCVGRAVEKKGHDVLLNALAALPAGLNWRFGHIGGGALTSALKRQAATLGIDDRIEWLGALPQGDVIERYRASDLFVLASRVGRDGDKDGLPNVLLEAQSQGLACVSTAVSAIPELIDDGRTGLLVPSEDPVALSKAIAALAADPARRRDLGAAGAARVRSEFSFDAGVDRLVVKLGGAAERGRSAA